jgi:phosphotriesterase-related protein
LDVVIDEGGDPTRVALCHLDVMPERVEYQMTLADRGAFVEYDSFGIEWTNDDRRAFERAERFIPPTPSDMERIRGLEKLAAAGFTDRILISHDVSVKLHLTKYGGYGYAHLLENLRPLMIDYGIPADALDLIMRANPQRLLAWAA